MFVGKWRLIGSTVGRKEGRCFGVVSVCCVCVCVCECV